MSHSHNTPAQISMQAAKSTPINSLIRKTQDFLMSLFGSPGRAVLSLLLLYVLWKILPGILSWAVFDAAFFPAVPETCKAATGACWSFVIAKSGQILVGIYPFEERWRPFLVCAIILVLLAWSVRPTSWSRKLSYVWIGVLIGIFWLMGGGYGLKPVETALWGGLPITLILIVVAIGLGFPLAIFFALGRRSEMPVLRLCCVIFIEGIRGLPLLSILFFASIMLPLFLPDSLLPDKFVRALVALTLFATAYLAEVIRGGLQSLPLGQVEAAKAVGLGYWRIQQLVVLPQAIKAVIPALANTIIVMIKNTSLVLVVGLFDVLSSGKAALADPTWPGAAAETYFFIALIFFSICFAFARFADFLEKRGAKTTH